MNYKSWEPLQPGDIVDVIAPGSALPKESLKRMEKFLATWGLKARYQKDILKPYLFHAAPDAIRSEHLLKALTAKDSKAVWCLRGGYGSNRLLPDLAKIRAPLTPKLFIGLSDITSLHLHLNDKWKWQTLHGPILDRAARGDLTASQVKELRGILFGTHQQVEFKNLKPLNKAALNVRRLKASILGGNLVTLQSTWGTPYQASLKNRFIFGEEIGERAYRVDRILEHLTQIPDYASCRGVLFGTFTDCKEADGKDLIPKTLKRFAEGTNIPVFAGLSVGHNLDQRCLPLSTNSEINFAKGKFTLTVNAGFNS